MQNTREIKVPQLVYTLSMCKLVDLVNPIVGQTWRLQSTWSFEVLISYMYESGQSIIRV